MCLGAAYINVSGNKELFDQINDFTPPVMCMFFVLSGMKLNIPGLSTVGIVGAGYFVIRIIGKYAGAFLGALTTKKDKKTRNCLGLALIPQAGVAIGLAALGERILGGSTGATLSTIILASSVIYEMVGPASAKLSLTLGGRNRQNFSRSRGRKPGGTAFRSCRPRRNTAFCRAARHCNAARRRDRFSFGGTAAGKPCSIQYRR